MCGQLISKFGSKIWLTNTFVRFSVIGELPLSHVCSLNGKTFRELRLYLADSMSGLDENAAVTYVDKTELT